MDRLKPERGGETLPFYASEKADLAKCWVRLLTLIEQHQQMEHLDSDTLWHVRAWMDLLVSKKPVPRILHEPDDIAPKYFLQADPNIDSETIALEFYRASQSSYKING